MLILDQKTTGQILSNQQAFIKNAKSADRDLAGLIVTLQSMQCFKYLNFNEYLFSYLILKSILYFYNIDDRWIQLFQQFWPTAINYCLLSGPQFYVKSDIFFINYPRGGEMSSDMVKMTNNNTTEERIRFFIIDNNIFTYYSYFRCN